MLPVFIPTYGVRPFIGLTVNVMLFILCAILALTHNRHKPMRSLAFFYLSLSVFFLGYFMYSFQGSTWEIKTWYRIMLVGMCWMPFGWLWFVSNLWGKGKAPLFWPVLVFAGVASVVMLVGDHPAILGGPLLPFEIGGVLRPQAWLMRPLIHTVGILVVVVSIHSIYFVLWPGPKRPAFVNPIGVGLMIWALFGLNDALYSWGVLDLFGGTILWLGGVWLSLCLAMATALYFRFLMSTNQTLEENLRQAQKLSALGALAGGVAHDFNNILQAASSCLEIMRHDDRLYSDGRSYLEELDNTLLKRGADLVRRMMAFSRKMEPKPGPVDLNEEVQSVAKILDRALPRNVDVERVLDSGLAKVHGDALGLQQALLNLSNNAADAMPDGGTLRLETKPVALDREAGVALGLPAGRYALLRVRDTGKGMDECTLAQAFQPFFTTKPEGKGTGLGLASVQSAVTRYGGRVKCTSREGLGTTFDIYLPFAAEQVGRDREAAPEPETGPAQAAGILLVDDEAAVLLSAAAYLQKMGFLVLTAVNGEEALDVYDRNRQRIDLVILDLAMPTMDGITCLNRLTVMDPGSKVLVTSGYAPSDAAMLEIEEKSEGFLSKPYPLSLLLVRVKEALAQGEAKEGFAA